MFIMCVLFFDNGLRWLRITSAYGARDLSGFRSVP